MDDRKESSQQEAAGISRSFAGAMRRERVAVQASDLLPDERFCTCCKRELKRTFVWLELDQRLNVYHDFGGVPSNSSQGWFPFGLACAVGEIQKAGTLIDASDDPALAAMRAALSGEVAS